MFDSIAPRYDLVNCLMTFGLDSPWRHRTIELLGTSPRRRRARRRLWDGRPRPQLAAPRPAWRSGSTCRSGCSPPPVRGALPSSRLTRRLLPFRTGAADAAVSGFAVRNFADLAGVMKELGRVVRPGGRLALLEVGEPRQPAAAPRPPCLVHPRRARARGAPLRRRGIPVPAPLGGLPALFRRARRLLDDAGFTDVGHTALSDGIAQCITATRSGGTVGS